MDGPRFDEIARRLGGQASRRAGLKATLAAALAALPGAAEATKRGTDKARGGPNAAGPCGNDPKKNACKKSADCCTGYCTKDGRCRCAPKGEKCTNKTACCNGFSCQNGRCRPDAVACDVCASGCPFSDLDAALAAAVDGAVIDVAPGNWTTSHAGGGIIADGRTVTVRACNGAAGVNVSSEDWSVFQVGDPGTGRWILEGLNVVSSPTNTSGHYLVYLNGTSANTRAVLTATDCAFLANGNPDNTIGIDTYDWSDVELTDCEISGQTQNALNSIFAAPNFDGSPNQVSLTRVTISGVTAVDEAAVTLEGCGAVFTDCTISGNTSQGQVAGIWIDATSTSDAALTLAGSTVVEDNLSTGVDSAGGIYVTTTSGRTVEIAIGANAAVRDNTGTKVGGVAHRSDGGGTLTLTGGSRITGNTPGQCASTVDGTTFTPVANCAF